MGEVITNPAAMDEVQDSLESNSVPDHALPLQFNNLSLEELEESIESFGEDLELAAELAYFEENDTEVDTDGADGDED